MKKRLLPLAACALIAPLQAQSISVNFATALDDANSVDPDESSVVGNPDGSTHGGARWNNLLLKSPTAPTNSPDQFIADTTGGTSITLIDDLGAAAASMTSTIASGGGWSYSPGVSAPNQTSTGDAGLFQSILGFGGASSSETLTISGLGSEFTDGGYKVLVFFDFGTARSRVYGMTVEGQTYWTNDVTGSDGDPENDGVIAWSKATGATSGTATTCNYAVFDGLSSPTLTISGVSTVGRAIISGLQIIANDQVFPRIIAAFTADDHYDKSNTHQLYNLATDPTESNDLATAQPETVMRMARALAQKLAATWGPSGPLTPTILPTSAPNGNVVSIPDLPAVDLDGDGLADTAEDPDLDGLVDPTETDPDNDNTDGDNIPDGAELRTGTDPLDPNSYFYLRGGFLPGGDVSLTWPSKPGARYEIRSGTDLVDWTTVLAADLPAADPGATTTFTVPSTALPREFYRIGLLP